MKQTPPYIANTVRKFRFALMKTWLNTIVPLLLFFSDSSAQTSVYHPFPDSGAVWVVKSTSIFNPGQWDYCFFYSNGDTLIDSTKFIKIFSPNPYCCILAVGTPDPTNFLIKIEEDSIYKKVDFYSCYSDSLIVLYDFNLMVGDTIGRGVGWCLDIDSSSIVSIDSILIGNSYRKRINTAGFYGGFASIIEGIGSTLGLFNPLTYFECYHYLDCFSLNDTVYYPGFYPDSTCDVIVNNDEPYKNINLQIYHRFNATNSTVTFNYFLQNSSPVTLNIFAITGQIIKSDCNLNGKVGLNQFELDINRFHQGIYFYTLSSNYFFTTNKLMLIK